MEEWISQIGRMTHCFGWSRTAAIRDVQMNNLKNSLISTEVEARNLRGGWEDTVGDTAMEIIYDEHYVISP